MSAVILLGVIASASGGAALARVLRLPVWPITGAVPGAAVFHLVATDQVHIPGWWMFVAQVAVGTSVGSRLGRSVISDFRRVLAPGLLVVLTIIPAGVGLGLLLAETNHIGLIESVFGMVPGGLGEMVAAVAALGGDSALVAGIHLTRLLIVVWSIQGMVSWLRRRQRRDVA